VTVPDVTKMFLITYLDSDVSIRHTQIVAIEVHGGMMVLYSKQSSTLSRNSIE